MPLTSTFSVTKATNNINCPFKPYDQYVKKKIAVTWSATRICAMYIYNCAVCSALSFTQPEGMRRGDRGWIPSGSSEGEARDEGAGGDDVETEDEGASGDKGDGAATRAEDEDEVEAGRRRGGGQGHACQSRGWGRR
jgi:hypothetical protein